MRHGVSSPASMGNDAFVGECHIPLPSKQPLPEVQVACHFRSILQLTTCMPTQAITSSWHGVEAKQGPLTKPATNLQLVQNIQTYAFEGVECPCLVKCGMFHSIERYSE
jgi:hypothetical protein